MKLLNRNRTTAPVGTLRNGEMQSRRRRRAGWMALTLGLGVAGMAAAPPHTPPGTSPSSTSPSNTSLAAKSAGRAGHAWFQIGRASWYGAHFNGHRTASGERFDSSALTCAHRSLPMGTWLRVTNLLNHRSLFVRVNDRGPVPKSRILDLSQAAARRLGVGGVARVSVQQINPADPQLIAEMAPQYDGPILPELAALTRGR
jgi:rare lipoprotein A